MAEEKKLLGHKPMKDRLALASCANISGSGDCKVKPPTVYHSKTPQAFKAHKGLKEKLLVIWRGKPKSWVTRHLFTEWVNLCFDRTVRKYLEEKCLPLKCLVVFDNAPAYPPGLEEDILADYSFIKVPYLSPNTTLLLQLMDQQVISEFKKLHPKNVCRSCFEITNKTSLTMCEFWKEHFDVVTYIRLIDQAWQEVSRRILNSLWKKLRPDTVSSRDFEGFLVGIAEAEAKKVDDPEPVAQLEVDEIVTLGRSMGLVVSENNINELLEEPQEELMMDDLKKLEAMHLNVVQEQFFRGEEEEEDPMTIVEIKRALAAFHTVQTFVEKRHPIKVYTGHLVAV
ncbi:tigger transposable element-derived protein 1-like [Palaemon carinicauda]|uniref:tigger transposable element-derived protein 1-like n=1 Tax=Palaemon carinicauda TaxID=392227 RepID=UPI0035B68861